MAVVPPSTSRRPPSRHRRGTHTSLPSVVHAVGVPTTRTAATVATTAKEIPLDISGHLTARCPNPTGSMSDPAARPPFCPPRPATHRCRQPTAAGHPAIPACRRPLLQAANAVAVAAIALDQPRMARIRSPAPRIRCIAGTPYLGAGRLTAAPVRQSTRGQHGEDLAATFLGVVRASQRTPPAAAMRERRRRLGGGGARGSRRVAPCGGRRGRGI
jgi:hypothetical protein